MITEDWIDVSVPLRTGMVHWPDNPPVSIERIQDIERGDVANVSRLSMGAHTGTHMDAPLHFLRTGKGIDTMPLTATIGRARVIEIHDPESIKPEELRPYQIQRGERVLFKTRNSTRCWHTDDFVEDFVYISQEAARYLAAQHVQTVGVDYLSVGGFFKDGVETHQALLEAGIWIIEGLNLSAVVPGIVELICLPLKIEESDGAPSRAILRLVEAI
jgi:arylformamidase